MAKSVKVRSYKKLGPTGKVQSVDAHMRTINVPKGTKVTNQFGEKRTILGVVDNMMAWTYEEPNTPYSLGKLFKGGKSLSNS